MLNFMVSYSKNKCYLLVKNIGCITIMALSVLNTILEYKLHLKNKDISDICFSCYFEMKIALHISRTTDLFHFYKANYRTLRKR